MFYVSAHTGVIHDTDQDMQYLLQGHVSTPVLSTSISPMHMQPCTPSPDFTTRPSAILVDQLFRSRRNNQLIHIRTALSHIRVHSYALDITTPAV